ncbi:MAG: dephospho-CoA kinase [Bacteroidales bacterium]
MLKIGLTGNIGCGKTTVAKVFKVLGIPVYSADYEAKKFLSHADVLNKLHQNFGEGIMTNASVDRKKLSDLVFADYTSLKFLNQLIHPLIKTDFENWLKLMPKDCPYIILEAAILFETGFDQYVDKSILVSSPKNICIQRVVARDQVTKADVMERMNNQWAEDLKRKLSNYEIVNDEQHLLIPQILEIHSRLINDRG